MFIVLHSRKIGLEPISIILEIIVLPLNYFLITRESENRTHNTAV